MKQQTKQTEEEKLNFLLPSRADYKKKQIISLKYELETLKEKKEEIKRRKETALKEYKEKLKLLNNELKKKKEKILYYRKEKKSLKGYGEEVKHLREWAKDRYNIKENKDTKEFI